jgi:hypothetical protein
MSRHSLDLHIRQSQRNYLMGRPLTIGLGTLIVLLLVVAFLF